jgi:DNA-binding XRE family transcriptional regulator
MSEIYVQTYFREWRKFSAYTQEEVATKLKVKRQTVARVEAGKADFTFKYLVMFANLVGCQHYSDPIMRAPDTMKFKGEDTFVFDPQRVREIREQLSRDDDS